ncbi:hypothetical protein [Echinimonas agarilytica]|uniref:Lipoprotein n=1 Tax=Echinimonas agarilytica TaxID=1215918 RepID=A0AA42B8M2_9GAMM|nr:hypothetical protein [Echinimonas agarilytica]MCM2681114.1 hypothetical protein [Echinimonas agarilytica]
MKLPVSIFLIILLTGCSLIVKSEATHILNGKAYPATLISDIEIYLEPPEKEYIVIGMVESAGQGIFTESEDFELSMKALKNEAASIGANALIIKSSDQVISSVSAEGSGTERRIKALAIRYK